MSNTLDTPPSVRPPRKKHSPLHEPSNKQTLTKFKKKKPSGWEMSASDALHVNYVDCELNSKKDL